MASPPRILFIDSYDSFSHNLAHLIIRSIPNSQLYFIHNDTLPFSKLRSLLPAFSACVVGPGPGSPLIDSDVGIIPELWRLPDDELLPIFGVCLGFQSLVLAGGGKLRRMNVVKHGMISRVAHVGMDIFEHIELVDATRYHSLCVDIVEEAGFIKPLAWAHDGENENGHVLMAARHTSKPFWGVQYHPESVCTIGGGHDVISNFWKLSSEWRRQHRAPCPILPEQYKQFLGSPWPGSFSPLTSQISVKSTRAVSTIKFKVGTNVPVGRLCEILNSGSPDQYNSVLLESAASPGRFTIIGCLHPDSLTVEYTLPREELDIRYGGKRAETTLLPPGFTIWDWLAQYMESMEVAPGSGGCVEVPFWGGLIGYFSYEAGVSELGVKPFCGSDTRDRPADVRIAMVERSVVIDHETGFVYVQSLMRDDNRWLNEAVQLIQNGACDEPHLDLPTESPLSSRLKTPPAQDYVQKVERCKQHLSIGSSYELCLTAPSILTLPAAYNNRSWDLYSSLRASNPAPHAAYLNLDSTTLLCSSPERFLKWDRDGHCELRPIKGTLRKNIVDESGQKHSISREEAEEKLIRNVKERAENLMIVDLVRHDLGGCVDPSDSEGVVVKQLMALEEYETVWQMVSVIGGTVKGQNGGWNLLRRSLPPGSMTGAPKKRSVELLQEIEAKERGIYSGVCGYWCVGGSGDWAVVIRSCFRHGVNQSNKAQENLSKAVSPTEEAWTIGAGGAITALSDPTAEWEEMQTKLSSVTRGFGVLQTSH